MSLEESIEEIKKMFWGVLKGKFSPDEEEDVKAHLITNLATLTSYAKSYLPPEQQDEYEKHFSKAKKVLLKFDSAGPWFRELPEMIDTIYNIITHANMLQIEYRRFSGTEENTAQYFQTKLESLEMNVSSMFEDLKKLKKQTATVLGTQIPVEAEGEEDVIDELPGEPKELPSVSEPEEEIEVSKTEDIEEFQPQEVIEDIQLDEEETVEKVIPAETQDLIEGIELASQYEFEQEPFVETIESEQESLKKLASLLSALDPGDDSVISPLTEKLMSLGDDEELPISEEPPIIEEGLSEEEIADAHAYRSSVSRLSGVLSAPESQEDTAQFVSSIKKTIATVSQEKDLEKGEKSPLTKIIEAETGEEAEKPPVQLEDIQNIIKHLESRREKAIERIHQLEEALTTEKIDEEEWHELRIKAERHMLRIEDTLDGYKRYFDKIPS
ncbi:MAG: hypothetical protein H7645_01120 [Candidatus Heimdallarchaeota archaeon]|nr:hypothetical protein [Candidatus Heimdallarchaeota archaeon]MCK4768916.1 hypothetical protein [Candidatus Heimdallarchaeota archaeon]